jgi:hypothetical protein
VIDSFRPSTWLAVSALLTSLIAWALPATSGSLTLLLATLLLYRLLDSLAALWRWKNDDTIASVLKGETTVLPSQTKDGEIVVFLVGSRINHPLGIFAPGAKTFSDYFTNMAKDLETQRHEFGMLGSSA